MWLLGQVETSIDDNLYADKVFQYYMSETTNEKHEELHDGEILEKRCAKMKIDLGIDQDEINDDNNYGSKYSESQREWRKIDSKDNNEIAHSKHSDNSILIELDKINEKISTNDKQILVNNDTNQDEHLKQLNENLDNSLIKRGLLETIKKNTKIREAQSEKYQNDINKELAKLNKLTKDLPARILL